MLINHLKENSGALMFRIALVVLLSLFVAGPGPGQFNIGAGQALADDDRDDRGDNDRHHGGRWDNRWHHKVNACAQTSKAALTACKLAAQEDYTIALGRCKNVAKSEQDDCKAKAKEEYGFALEECPEQFEARQEVCEAIGPGPYLPEGIDPDDFEEEPNGNNYFPLIPGTKYTYKLYSGGAILETIVVEVKDATREIEEVTCRVVQDTVYEGDVQEGDVQVEKIEDTTDWYALKGDDVWYLGEIALNFEEGVVTNIDGSWTAGVEGAKPGIVMYGDPAAHEGETYRQEFALSEAEDVATIVEILTYEQFKDNVLNPVPLVFGAGPFLHTKDFSALEPGVVEDKYYGKDVGNVLIVKPATDTDPEQMEVLVTVDTTP